MNYDELCKTTLELDPKIRFTGALNHRGDLMAGGTRDGVEQLLSSEEVTMSVHYTRERWEKAQNLAHKIGNEKFAVIEYDKVTLVTIPFGKNELFLMSTEPDADYFTIVKKTQDLLNSQKDQ